ncbi:TPA_asm: coat protein [ssRNA phage Gerhypos.1_47]|uniref:Coat protein n=2 Tax=Leviviricetes TaxID=2842243 RepID=A0A8S5L3Z6_9VIRU|nr:coat protein [ssRNA phage Gerhypos.1_47]QDH90037.1 MAG: hypothetical protein H1Bulk30299_000002 [Leviviridae sp.]DAD52140.1 TPA_asm: coat protein [ssRNA phage Gerhypos.1_47]
MSLTYPLSLTDNAGSTKTFAETIRNGQVTESVDTASTSLEPRRVRISHTQTKSKDGIVTDRHLISLSDTQVESTGSTSSMVINLTVALPRSASFSSTNVKDGLRMIFDLLTTSTAPTIDSTALDQILRGES